MGLNAKNFGLAGGILWGAVMFLITLISYFTGYAVDFLGLMSTIYPGYVITILGSLWGMVYGFVDGFIGLYVFAWLYNYLEGRTGYYRKSSKKVSKNDYYNKKPARAKKK